MGYPVIINAFHGTSEKSAIIISKEKAYKYMDRDNHWLGPGAYFFRDDPEQAMSWAICQVNPGEYAAVIQNIIEVDSINFMDLNTKTGIYKLQEFLKQAGFLKPDKSLEYGVNITEIPNKRDSNILRNYILASISKDDIKVIQMNFLIDQPKNISRYLFDELDIRLDSVQVCVRDEQVLLKDSIKIVNKKVNYMRKKRSRKSYTFRENKPISKSEI